jgi:hypothetical protein
MSDQWSEGFDAGVNWYKHYLKETKMKPHKWAKEIKAWADGAEIEYRRNLGDTGWQRWIKFSALGIWYEGDAYEYRIIPKPKEPQYLYVYRHDGKLEIFTEELNIINSNRLQYIGKIKLEEFKHEST